MSYKIAIASSDGINIDRSFGAASGFYIYEADNTTYKRIEIRGYYEGHSAQQDSSKECGSKGGCKSGCNSGCGNGGEESPKISLVEDCRCIICSKIGFQVRKQLEKKAITAFDIEISIEEALDKIVQYFYKVDQHISLRSKE